MLFAPLARAYVGIMMLELRWTEKIHENVFIFMSACIFFRYFTVIL